MDDANLAEIKDPKLRRTLQSFGKTVAEKSAREQNTEPDEPPKKAEVIQLPLWPEPARGVPNVVLRSALFPAIDPRKRLSFKRKIIAVQGKFEVRFTGVQFCQSDLDVWEQVTHLARLHPLGTTCTFTASSFLKASGRSTGKWMHEWLKETISLLQSGSVEITKDGKDTYFGSLIEEGARDEHTGRYVLKLNPNLIALFNEGWTATDWEQRKLLKKKPLALWMHGFLSTHAEPFPMKIETLMTLSGSQTKAKKRFKDNLKTALEVLKDVGAVTCYDFDGDLVSVERPPSPAQHRHLTKKSRKRR